MSIQQTVGFELRVEQRPACQRCGHRDRRGLANVRGLKLCGVCHLISIARFRLAA